MNRIEREQLDLKISATRAKLRKAFVALRRQGYVARMNYLCCQGCGSAAMDLKDKKGGVFWHHQDDDGFKEDGELYIAFLTENGDGSVKVGEALVAALKAENVWVEWDGSSDTRVLVKA